MTDFALVLASSLWLGVLTSISPCPLATNVAAISFLSRRFRKTPYVLLTGVLYAVGRMLAYVILGVLIVSSILSMPALSFFLQKYMHIVLGPLLIVVGMFLVELISIRFPGLGFSQRAQEKFQQPGFLGSIPLGFLFALAFCPVSAGLFFGALIPLAVKTHSTVMLPSAYGAGTALPVLLFAVAFVWGTKSVAGIFNKVTAFEKWLRLTTGTLIILIGIYFCLAYIFEVL